MPKRVQAWKPRKPAPLARPTSAQRGYGTAVWQRLRLQVIARDRGVCQLCGELIVGESGDVDHIIPKPAGRDELSNLRLCHHACHSRRTAADCGLSSRLREPPRS